MTFKLFNALTKHLVSYTGLLIRSVLYLVEFVLVNYFIYLFIYLIQLNVSQRFEAVHYRKGTRLVENVAHAVPISRLLGDPS